MDENQVSPAPETQNPAPELAVTPEVANPETTNEVPEQPKEPDPADKAVKGLLRRVDRLTAARYQEQARAEQLARENEQLRQMLPRNEDSHEELTPDKVLPIARHMAEQIVKQDTVAKGVASVLKAGKALDGFDTACNAVHEVLPFYNRDGSPTAFLSEVIEESAAPERLLHYLGTHPDELEELAGLPPNKLARRLDRIERKLSEPAEPKVSTAPKPITPVRTATRDDGGLSDNLSTAEWIKRRNAALRG